MNRTESPRQRHCDRGATASRSSARIARGTFACALALLFFFAYASAAGAPPRVTHDLEALYTFDEGSGGLVRDISAAGHGVDLKIEHPDNVRWREGHLVVRAATRIASREPARKVVDAVTRSGEVTIEAWVKPADDGQSGPARIVTLSADPNRRNLTLGQDGKRYEVRLRATSTSDNGIPATSSTGGSLRSELTHVVYTRNRAGRTRVYLNGKRDAAAEAGGDLSSWDGAFRLAVANELTGDRPWLGELHLVALYSRALSKEEVAANFDAGSESAPPASVAREAEANQPDEEKQVARERSPEPSDEVTQATAVSPAFAARTSRGLRALYTFEEGGGERIRDRSGVGTPFDLVVDKEGAVRWIPGGLVVRSSTLIKSQEPPRKLYRAVKRSGELSIEAWLKPANDSQDGPARIVSISLDTGVRNVTLGQAAGQFDVRLRTSTSTTNGMPSVSTPKGSLRPELTHVVYARDTSGAIKVFIDGKERASGTAAGDLAVWDEGFRLFLANEGSGDRPWLGELYLVAFYNRALTAEDAARNFAAGSEVAAPASSLASIVHASAELEAERANAALEVEASSVEFFDAHVAPVLARNCLECHRARRSKGRLDLSTHAALLAGGKSGPAVVPGKSAESLLWKRVESGEMPEERPPLSAREKEIVKQWIDAGAPWFGDSIEPRMASGDGEGVEFWLSRLTVAEYVETVESAVGVDVADDAQRILPRDVRADGFSNTAYSLAVDFEHVEAYAKLAATIVERADVAALVDEFAPCRDLTAHCMSRVIADLGRWILRGPLEEREIGTYLRIPTAVADEGGEFDEAVRGVLEAMLQSPRFIYRIERQRGDGSTTRAGDFELASRVSYILWGAPPDRELMRAATAGELGDTERLASQVQRMLDDPRAVRRSLQFADEWLHLGRLEHLQPGRERFPGWAPELAADMRDETLAFFEDLVWKEKRPLAELMNAQFTYASPRLAAHYGLAASDGDQSQAKSEPNSGGDGDGAASRHALRRYDLSSVPERGGLLTHGSILTVGGDDASMVTRGLFVLFDFLDGSVDDPPPGVDTTPIPAEAGMSRRDVAQRRLDNPSCGGCHGSFEPLAFGFEKFDGTGAHSGTDEHGNALREDGQVLFPGADEPVAYATTSQLMDILAGSARVRECITKKVTQFALGRPLTETDAPALAAIHASAEEGGGTYGSLITAIVMSDLVRMTRTEPAR